jgi:hypothetical protein
VDGQRQVAKAVYDFLIGDTLQDIETAVRDTTIEAAVAVVCGIVKPCKAAKRGGGIVYRRVDRNNLGGKCYIGRCDNDRLYQRRQRDHSRENPDADYEFEVIDRAQPGPALRQAEQRQIDAHGGPTNRSNPNGGTENRRNEVGRCRRDSKGKDAPIGAC